MKTINISCSMFFFLFKCSLTFSGLEYVLTDLRRTSNYIGITDKFDHEDACISKSKLYI
jgi:hypothetical protein